MLRTAAPISGPAAAGGKPTRGAAALLQRIEKKFDPFGKGADRVMLDMKAGMEMLLDMHSPVELSSLCGALGVLEPVTSPERKSAVMHYIREGRHQAEQRFAEVLRFVWEGLLFEYLRSVGCPVFTAERDPRIYVLKYWRRSTTDPRGAASFVPYYLERRVYARADGQPEEDPDVGEVRARIMGAEVAVKEAEALVRASRDYRHILTYFSATADLHREAGEASLGVRRCEAATRAEAPAPREAPLPPRPRMRDAVSAGHGHCASCAVGAPRAEGTASTASSWTARVTSQQSMSRRAQLPAPPERVQCSEYLCNEVEVLRARLGHCEETVRVLSEQATELERKYDSVVGALVTSGAAHDAAADALLSALAARAADAAALTRTARAVFLAMDAGPDPDGRHDADRLDGARDGDGGDSGVDGGYSDRCRRRRRRSSSGSSSSSGGGGAEGRVSTHAGSSADRNAGRSGSSGGGGGGGGSTDVLECTEPRNRSGDSSTRKAAHGGGAPPAKLRSVRFSCAANATEGTSRRIGDCDAIGDDTAAADGDSLDLGGYVDEQVEETDTVDMGSGSSGGRRHSGADDFDVIMAGFDVDGGSGDMLWSRPCDTEAAPPELEVSAPPTAAAAAAAAAEVPETEMQPLTDSYAAAAAAAATASEVDDEAPAHLKWVWQVTLSMRSAPAAAAVAAVDRLDAHALIAQIGARHALARRRHAARAAWLRAERDEALALAAAADAAAAAATQRAEAAEASTARWEERCGDAEMRCEVAEYAAAAAGSAAEETAAAAAAQRAATLAAAAPVARALALSFDAAARGRGAQLAAALGLDGAALAEARAMYCAELESRAAALLAPPPPRGGGAAGAKKKGRGRSAPAAGKRGGSPAARGRGRSPRKSSPGPKRGGSKSPKGGSASPKKRRSKSPTKRGGSGGAKKRASGSPKKRGSSGSPKKRGSSGSPKKRGSSGSPKKRGSGSPTSPKKRHSGSPKTRGSSGSPTKSSGSPTKRKGSSSPEKRGSGGAGTKARGRSTTPKTPGSGSGSPAKRGSGSGSPAKSGGGKGKGGASASPAGTKRASGAKGERRGRSGSGAPRSSDAGDGLRPQSSDGTLAEKRSSSSSSAAAGKSRGRSGSGARRHSASVSPQQRLSRHNSRTDHAAAGDSPYQEGGQLPSSDSPEKRPEKRRPSQSSSPAGRRSRGGSVSGGIGGTGASQARGAGRKPKADGKGTKHK
ncbi:hypothetical protein JKP88DRAFT_277114 [Tribonema minus]|uniref:Uncharacterized protein n=1 Tax=Tribonema minus TaxID=303371 RepID=A0A836CGG2_9STRA|nr:hypothetical protein JKP88DRAFT_277114 [Tribonema minus]